MLMALFIGITATDPLGSLRSRGKTSDLPTRIPLLCQSECDFPFRLRHYTVSSVENGLDEPGKDAMDDQCPGKERQRNEACAVSVYLPIGWSAFL